MNPFQRFSTILFVTLSASLFAQDPPTNDSYQTATALTVQAGACSDQTQGDLTYATNSNNSDYSSSCLNLDYDSSSPVAYADMWYKATVPSSGNLVIETSAVFGSPLSDTILVAYTLNEGVLT